MSQFTRQTHAQSRSELEQALEINPAFTPALVQLGYALTDQARFGWVEDRAATYEAAMSCVQRALAADPGCGHAYTRLCSSVPASSRRGSCGRRRGGDAVAKRVGAFHMAGMYHGYAGDFQKAALYEEQAQRLSPIARNESMVDEARARFHLGDLNAARSIALRVLNARPRWLTAQTTLIAALWSLQKEDQGRAIAKGIMAGHPRFSVDRRARGLPHRHQEHLDALIEPLRLAGLPQLADGAGSAITRHKQKTRSFDRASDPWC